VQKNSARQRVVAFARSRVRVAVVVGATPAVDHSAPRPRL
jgi:hypothetical protein